MTNTFLIIFSHLIILKKYVLVAILSIVNIFSSKYQTQSILSSFFRCRINCPVVDHTWESGVFCVSFSRLYFSFKFLWFSDSASWFIPHIFFWFNQNFWLQGLKKVFWIRISSIDELGSYLFLFSWWH